jgi:predicted transcriptional regulator
LRSVIGNNYRRVPRFSRGLRAGLLAVDVIPGISTLRAMEVHLTPDLQAKLSRLAAEQGRKVQEAIARFVDYDEWFIREVEKGLASADRGELLTHEEAGARLEKVIAEKQAHR